MSAQLPQQIAHERIQLALENQTDNLDLSGLLLDSLPLEIAELTNLQSLDLRSNQLSGLPTELFQLTNLQSLILSNNRLSSLPGEIVQLTNLQSLDLSGNQLGSLPAEIVQLTNLQSLDLSGNQLGSLPAEIGQLTNLQSLYLTRNQLSSLPAEIGQLTNLQSLVLQENNLSDVPIEIFMLRKLRELSLWGNGIAVLPDEIKNLRNLKILHLGDNKLGVFPIIVLELNNLRELYLWENQLNSIPKEINRLRKLKVLAIGRNKISTLPVEIGELSELQDLTIFFNKFCLFPLSVFGLTNLQSLNLRGNQLSSLPAEIGQLAKLQSLELNENQLSSLPVEIGQLANLQSLDLSGNQLSSLPAEIGQLTNLQSLTLMNNQLSSLPAEIGQLTKLRLLTLVNNQLSDLPGEISQLKARIWIEENPFGKFPPEIVEQGSQEILGYLAEIVASSREQWVSKLMLVGEGGVGKTSLLRALRNEPFMDISTTKGIEICSLCLPHPQQDGIELTLNAWDFGGQEIYHATHQFFLTNRSLFLLLWNARHGYEQGKLYYWLDAIQARAPESPILVVSTWTDERDADLPTADLQAKYPKIAGFYNISNKSGAGVAELREAINQVAISQLPLMGEKWPTSWLNAATALRDRPEKYLTPQAFHALVNECGVSESGERVLARWLHELGDILYFRDDTDLNDLVILKPEWVTKYIGKVLESEDVIGRQGIYTQEHMKTLWGDLDPSMHQHFLRLMEKFDLSYRTLEDREVSLIVERLPLDPPDLAIWQETAGQTGQNEISMKFKLNTILPGIPTWFIAREHRFTTHTHWRMGGVFQDAEKKHLALLQAFPHDRYIQLTVRGPSPHDFFALMRDGFELTLQRYPGLKTQRTMPCPGHDGQPCDYEFDYENLKRAIEREKPKETIECQKELEDISIFQLLFGLHWRTQDQVLEKIDELRVQLADHAEQHNELVALLQREFAKNFHREQRQVESYCPNVFTLSPYNAGSWKRFLVGEKLELQLYCQAPGCWHPVNEGGRYVFDNPPKWLRATGKYIQEMVKVLKYVTPFMGPWVGMASEEYAKLIANDLKMMENLVKILPEVAEIDETREMKLVDRLEKFPDLLPPDLPLEGAPLRAIRLLLDKLDANQTWGGLKLVLTPEDHYLWLCEHHAQEYKQ